MFQKVYRTRKFQRQEGEGRLSRFSVEIVVSYSNETFCRGTLLCFRKLLVPKNVWDRKAWRLSRFSVHTFFRLTLQKSYLGAHSWNSKKLWYRNLTRRNVEGCLSKPSVEIFSSENTDRISPLLCIRILLVSRVFMDKRGGRIITIL